MPRKISIEIETAIQDIWNEFATDDWWPSAPQVIEVFNDRHPDKKLPSYRKITFLLKPLRDSKKKVCGSCKYFEPNETTPDEGVCHRYPPQPFPDSDDGLGVFTVVDKTDDWCGEFEIRSKLLPGRQSIQSSKEKK